MASKKFFYYENEISVDVKENGVELTFEDNTTMFLDNSIIFTYDEGGSRHCCSYAIHGLKIFDGVAFIDTHYRDSKDVTKVVMRFPKLADYFSCQEMFDEFTFYVTSKINDGTWDDDYSIDCFKNIIKDTNWLYLAWESYYWRDDAKWYVINDKANRVEEYNFLDYKIYYALETTLDAYIKRYTDMYHLIKFIKDKYSLFQEKNVAAIEEAFEDFDGMPFDYDINIIDDFKDELTDYIKENGGNVSVHQFVCHKFFVDFVNKITK